MPNERALNRTAVLAAIGVAGASVAAAMAIRVLAELLGRGGGDVTLPQMLFEGAVIMALMLTLSLRFRRLQIDARTDTRSVAATALSKMDLRRAAEDLGVTRVAFIVAFTCLILTFQLASTTQVRPFPFTHWAMYTRPAPSSDFPQVLAEFESGRIAHYPFLLIQRTSPRSFMARFRPALDAAVDPARGDDERAEARASLGEAMRVLAAIHDRRRPDDRIVAMEAARMTVYTDEYSGPESVRREVAVRVEFVRR